MNVPLLFKQIAHISLCILFNNINKYLINPENNETYLIVTLVIVNLLKYI